MFEPCDCPEAAFLRELLELGNSDGPITPPDTALWRAIEQMAEIIAVRKLRSLSHDLADAADWTGHRPGQPPTWTERDVPAWATANGRSTRQNMESWDSGNGSNGSSRY